MRSEGKAPKNREATIGFFYDNAPAHRSVLVKYLLTKNDVTTQEFPPIFPDLAPPDFYAYLFLRNVNNIDGR